MLLKWKRPLNAVFGNVGTIVPSVSALKMPNCLKRNEFMATDIVNLARFTFADD